MMWRDVGLTGLGAYIPEFRIKEGALAEPWGLADGGAAEKSVPNDDEDATTMAVEAARAAVADARVSPAELDAVWVGTASKPYAAKAVSATVAKVVGATPWVGAVDLEFTSRSAMEGLNALAALIETGRCRNALLVAVDAVLGRPGDELERASGAGAAAFSLGKAERSMLLLSDWVTYITDTPDSYRRDGADYPVQAHRFSGQSAYVDHVRQAVGMFFERTATKAADFRFAVFHQPSSKLPRQAAKSLGFTCEQVEPVQLVDRIGNCCAANSLLSLIRAIDLVEAGDQILVTSYGSGAGADCFAIKATSRFHARKPRLDGFLERATLLRNYGEYLKMTRQAGGRPR